MKLYDYLKQCKDGEEITIFDNVYDMETYIYTDMDYNDRWEKSIIELSKILTITDFTTSKKIVVNLSEIIEKNIDKLREADLFIRCNTDSIMYGMGNILSGYVSEDWLEKFVNTIKS